MCNKVLNNNNNNKFEEVYCSKPRAEPDKFNVQRADVENIALHLTGLRSPIKKG